MTEKNDPVADFGDFTDVRADWIVFAKAYAKDYKTSPFYFTQTRPDGKVRIACWCCDPRYTWGTAEALLSAFPDDIDVLMKVNAVEPAENDPWDRYHRSGLAKPLVLATVRKYEDYILGDASNELGIRNSHTNEYLYYDCAGILWLYPTDAGKGWCELLEDHQFQLEYRPLISNVFHWSRRAKEAEKLRDGFILDLRLEPGEKAYE